METLYVSTTGRDSHSGSRQRPLRSLVGARNRIRILRKKGRADEPVTVCFDSGEYPMDETVVFGPEDSNVTYRGVEGSVIEGGRRITGWRVTEIHGVLAWVKDLPEVRKGHWYFRQLFVNGRRCPRARTPKFDPVGIANRNVLRIAEFRKRPDGGLPKFSEGDFRFLPNQGDIGDWPSLGDAEIVLLHRWIEDRLPQPRLIPETGWVECGRRSVFVLNEDKGDTRARYYIDNLFEALSEPGEWYLDRHRGKLFYLPKPGESPENVEVMAPRLCRFITVKGIPFQREKCQGDLHGITPVRNLRFERLTFRHADWIQPEARMLFHDDVAESERPLAGSVQGAIHVPGTLSFLAAQDCAVRNCRIEHVGFYAIELDAGCRGMEISGNDLSDLGAGGIKIHGGEVDEAGWKRTGHTSVCDNTILQGGRVFHGAIGILLGNTFENVVAHNRIEDFLYTGISVGWSWGYRETISRENAILCNRIHRIGQGLLSDMGAIYTLGLQPGTVIGGNEVVDVRAHAYGGWGLYLDEGSSHIVVEQNLVLNTQGPCLQLHVGRENIVRENIFISLEGGIASIGRAEGFTSATFDHNLFFAGNGLIYRGRYSTPPTEGFRSDVNWILYPRGTRLHCGNQPDPNLVPFSWKTWLKQGNDSRSLRQEIEADVLPSSPRDVASFLKGKEEAKDFGLIEPMWKKAGPRPPSRRESMWQPLWRR